MRASDARSPSNICAPIDNVETVSFYDQAGRVTSETDAEGTASFTYDKANELTGVTGSRTESYSYDLNGNRNSTGYSTGTGNEQTASPGFTYTYDNAGNMISQTNTSTGVTTTYTYDDRNRLTEVTTGGTVVATYTYDALNNRIGVDDNGTQTWTVYDGTNPYADFNGSGSLEVRYQYGPGMVDGAVVDELLARTSASGSTAWYLTDKLGSVRDIVSSSASELDHVVYDSFGNIVTETNTANGDRFKFAGMEFDAVIGQYYDHARSYAPATGRFTSQDPYGFAAGSDDLYVYVSNSPTAFVDPFGLQEQGPPPVWDPSVSLEQAIQRFQQKSLERQKEIEVTTAQEEQSMAAKLAQGEADISAQERKAFDVGIAKGLIDVKNLAVSIRANTRALLRFTAQELRKAELQHSAEAVEFLATITTLGKLESKQAETSKALTLLREKRKKMAIIIEQRMEAQDQAQAREAAAGQQRMAAGGMAAAYQNLANKLQAAAAAAAVLQRNLENAAAAARAAAAQAAANQRQGNKP